MILLKKALRSMLQNKGAYAACIVLITTGILIYVSMGIASATLEKSKNLYYEQNKMADIFAKVNEIPESAKNSLLQIPGISEVSMRLVYDVRVVNLDTDKIVTIRLISIDPTEENPINKINTTQNVSMPEDDILVNEDFLTSHHLEVVDSIAVIIDGREIKFTISGLAASPEYVYVIKDAKEILPDPETFSIAYLPIENMANVFNKKAVYNDVCFMLQEGYSFDDVKIALEDSLKPYGLLSLLPQKDQVSFSILESEIKGNKSMTTTIPYAFVLMAIVVLYLMLMRSIEQDRMQIGTLKAFGYSNGVIILHYMFYGLVIGVLGGSLGSISGYFLSGTFGEVYNQFYKLPETHVDVAAGYVLTGYIIAISGGLAGAYMGTKSVLKLNPSEAMRAVAPKITKNDILRFLPFLKYVLEPTGSMALRSIIRNKVRSVFIVIGVMFSFGMLAFMGSYNSMIDEIMMNQFTMVQKYDGKVSFHTPVSYTNGVESVVHIEGVKTAEGLLEIPVTFSNKHRKESVVIIGIEENASLYKIYDNSLKKNLTAPTNGVILSNALAKKLEAKPGDELYIKSLITEEELKVMVVDIVTQNLGSSSYMEINALNRLFHLDADVTSVIFETDDMAYIKEFLKEGKNVSVIEDKERTLESYTSFLGSYDAIIVILEIFAVVVAFAIIYNTATISLSERKREYATLRVLGLQVKEVSEIIGFEYWVLSFFGIMLGFPFTMFLKEALAKSMEMDLFTFPTYTPTGAYVMGILGCITAVYISNVSTSMQIKKFDMVEVLKERE